MNLLDLTPEQLKRAASIKEQMEALHKELTRILGTPSADGRPADNQRTMSAVAKRKIAAAQKARWARLRDARGSKAVSKTKAKKQRMSAAARAKVSAKLKAYWAAKKAGKK